MTFWELIALHLIAGPGMTNIIVNGTIFYPIRPKLANSDGKIASFFKELIHCSTCTGFWSGVLLELLTGCQLIPIWGLYGNLISIFIGGCLTSLASEVADRWKNKHL